MNKLRVGIVFGGRSTPPRIKRTRSHRSDN